MIFLPRGVALAPDRIKNLNGVRVSKGVFDKKYVQVYQDEDEENATDKEPVWIPIVGGPFTKADRICADLRRLQSRSGCSNATVENFLEIFSKYLGITTPAPLKKYDKAIQKAAGAQVLRLNGCENCHRHVYLPSDPAKFCPHCGGDRFRECGKPFEQVFYFPIKSKIEALLRVPSYNKMLVLLFPC